VSDASPDQTLTPAERERRWDLSLRLAIEAASEAEAQAITSQVLSRLRRELPLQGKPVITPLPARDGLWDATLHPDPALLEGIKPDDATNCCRYVSHHFGPDPLWISRASQREARWDWPPDIWSRQPGTDDVLLHTAVQAVMIWCRRREPEQTPRGTVPTLARSRSGKDSGPRSQGCTGRTHVARPGYRPAGDRIQARTRPA
jgi:hypothetical protein